MYFYYIMFLPSSRNLVVLNILIIIKTMDSIKNIIVMFLTEIYVAIV